MPKMKTISSAKKRFKLTSRGKVRKASAFHRHNFSQKSGKRGRRLRKTTLVNSSDAPQIRRMLAS